MYQIEISDSISDGLEDQAHEYWVGMCNKDRNDLIIQVQKGESSIASCQETIQKWAKDARDETEEVPDYETHR